MTPREFRQEQEFEFGHFQELTSTALSMFYIACCAFVLMKHNGIAYGVVLMFANGLYIARSHAQT